MRDWSFYSLSLSLYCTLMFTSSYVAAGKAFTEAAFGGGAKAIEARIQEITTMPMPTAQATQSGIAILQASRVNPDEPLAVVYEGVSKSSFTISIPAALCGMIGFNDGTAKMNMWTHYESVGSETKKIHTTNVRGSKDIMMASNIGIETYFYRTTSDGVLINSIYWKKGSNAEFVPNGEAAERFKKEKEFWVAHYSSGSGNASAPGSK